MNTMAQLIRDVRGQRSLTQFARDIGVSISSLSRYESGERRPNIDNLGPILVEATPEQAKQILEFLGIEDVGSFATALQRTQRQQQEAA